MPLAYWTRNAQDIQYYDYLLGRYNSVDLNMLFLIGYSAATGHTHASDHIWIPRSIKDKNGDELVSGNGFFLKAHEYLDEKWRIDVTEDDIYFDIWAFRFLLDELGFVTGNSGKIPNLMVSSDWNPMHLDDSLQFEPPVRNDGETDAEYAMRYDSEYMDWNASRKMINYTARYQLAEGFLYGLTDMGYGMMPFIRRDTSWYNGNSVGILRSAIDTIHNPVYRGREDLQGRNIFYNMENADPLYLTDTVGSLSQTDGNLWEDPTDGRDTLTGNLFGEIDLPSFPDMWRYAVISVHEDIEVQMTFWMVVGRMIPKVYVAAIVENADILHDAGSFDIRAKADVTRVPLSVVDVHVNNSTRIKFPIHTDITSVEYTLPDVYFDASLGELDRGGLGQDISHGAYVIAQQTQMLNGDLNAEPAKPHSDVSVYYTTDIRFHESGITYPGQECMYGLMAQGIDQVLYVKSVSDAGFTREQIERLTEDEINRMHFMPIQGNIVNVTNVYDSDRPNLVIRVSFDFSESSGLMSIASLVFYASRKEDGRVIPFAMMSIGNAKASVFDTTSMREMEMSLTLKDI